MAFPNFLPYDAYREHCSHFSAGLHEAVSDNLPSRRQTQNAEGTPVAARQATCLSALAYSALAALILADAQSDLSHTA